MKKIFLILSAAALMTACNNWEPSPWIDGTPEPEQPDDPTPGQDKYNEKFRPQVHYSPSKNWVNDPNGLVYLDGTWHMFYQYNPYGNDWGNMSWGHATSTDLMHWQEQAVAISKSDLSCGDIFSGSCVVDKDNTAGFGANAIVAIYTGAAERQQQCIAYSTDNGATFTQYNGNPVIANTTRDHFRDPKVFWHEATHQWVMALALGTEQGVEFWGSKNLKDWTSLSQFKLPNLISTEGAQWECPDLVNMGEKWVLIVSVNPGALNFGSGTMYFTGDFDGTNFVADANDYPLWLDYGADNYAGVTWSNAPDGRKVLIGWMNNWNYCGQSPVHPWRSSFTMPRELSLVKADGKHYLANHPVAEVDKIAGEWKEIGQGRFSSQLGDNVCSHVRVEFNSMSNGTITLSNSLNEQLVIGVKAGAETVIAERDNKTGYTAFNGNFSLPAVKADFPRTEFKYLDIFIDQSSVEIFSNDGTMVQTNTVYPDEAYNTITLEGVNASLKVRPLKSVWR